MPYTDNPIANPLDAIRLLIGDTKPVGADFSDNEIAFFLSEEGSVTRAAARAAESLSAKYAGVASSRKVGPLDLTFGTRGQTKAMEYAKLAKLLWAQAATETVKVYAGGISVSDKAANLQDRDRSRTAARRGMMPYRRGMSSQNRQVTPEEITSSEEILP